jgi:hypothetical protein
MIPEAEELPDYAHLYHLIWRWIIERRREGMVLETSDALCPAVRMASTVDFPADLAL